MAKPRTQPPVIPQTQPPASAAAHTGKSFARQAASFSLLASFVSIVIYIIGHKPVQANPVGVIILGGTCALLILLGFVFGIVALIGMRKHERKGTFGRAIAGVCINGVLIFFMVMAIPSFTKTVQQAKGMPQPQPQPQQQALVVEDNTPIVGAAHFTTEGLGIVTLGGVFSPLIKSGNAVPCSLSEVFSTATDGQTQIRVTVFRGNNHMAASNHALGQFQVVGIPAAMRGTTKIEITFAITQTQILLSARDLTHKTDLVIQRLSEDTKP